MNKFYLIIFIFYFQSSFAQDNDTTFVIQTPKSTIKVVCKKTFENGKLIHSSIFLLATVHITQSTIDEAIELGIESDNYYVNLNYNENCELKSLSKLRASKNSSFNYEALSYFQEFVDAYNSNNLKRYFISILKNVVPINLLSLTMLNDLATM